MEQKKFLEDILEHFVSMLDRALDAPLLAVLSSAYLIYCYLSSTIFIKLVRSFNCVVELFIRTLLISLFVCEELFAPI